MQSISCEMPDWMNPKLESRLPGNSSGQQVSSYSWSTDLNIVFINLNFCVLKYRDGNTRPPNLPLRNLYTGKVATVRAGHGTTDWFQIGKGVHQGCILSPCLFSLYAEYIMRNAGLEEAQAGIKIAGRISITSDMQMTPTLWQKVKKN